MHVYEVRPRKDKRGVDLISDALPFGRLWYTKPDNAIGYAMHSSRSHDAMIRVYDDAGNMIRRTSTGAISRIGKLFFVASYTADRIRHALPIVPFTFAKDALFAESDSKSSEFQFASIYIHSKELIFAKQFR